MMMMMMMMMMIHIQGVIEMSRVDGSERRVLVADFRQQKPSSIAIDPDNR